MRHITSLRIYFSLGRDQSVADALNGLPEYCTESFQEHAEGHWHGEFIISCPVAPLLADGDLVTDLAPYFPQLLNLKTFYGASFVLQIAIGSPAPENFDLESHIIAMLAALDAELQISSNKGISAPRSLPSV